MTRSEALFPTAPLLLRNFNHRLRNRRRFIVVPPPRKSGEKYIYGARKIRKQNIRYVYYPIVNRCMKMRSRVCSGLKLCAERAKIELLIWNCRSARNQFMERCTVPHRTRKIIRLSFRYSPRKGEYFNRVSPRPFTCARRFFSFFLSFFSSPAIAPTYGPAKNINLTGERLT